MSKTWKDSPELAARRAARKDVRRPCPVAGCPNVIQAKHALCFTHWHVLGARHRAEIMRQYDLAAGSAEHLAAIAQAAESLAGQRVSQR